MPDAIILAGGLGTRLRSEVPDLPKCMAPVAGKPFLDYVITYLIGQGVNRFIFALGYKHEAILKHLETNWPDLMFEFTVEDTPLGTGGGIRLAAQKVIGSSYFVLNGDTFFDVDLNGLQSMHVGNEAEVTIALKKMFKFDRYGAVVVDEHHIIKKFQEKTYRESGLINGGIYLVQKQFLDQINVTGPFSFEKEVLERFVEKKCIFGFESNGYFIDIGIPEDFKKANKDFKN